MKKTIIAMFMAALLTIVLSGCSSSGSVNSSTTNTSIVPSGANESSTVPIASSNGDMPFEETEDYKILEELSLKFAVAYFTQDVDTMKSMVTEDIGVPFEDFEQTVWRYADLDHFVLKGLRGDQDEAHASYEFKSKEEDSYSYLVIDFVKVDGTWLVNFFTAEK